MSETVSTNVTKSDNLLLAGSFTRAYFTFQISGINGSCSSRLHNLNELGGEEMKSAKPTSLSVTAAALFLSLAACGGDDSGSGMPIQATPPPAPPTPQQQNFTPVQGASREIGSDFVSLNFNLLPAANHIKDPAFIEAVSALKPGSLRIPGGTTSEYWDWSKGGIKDPPYTGLPDASPFGPGILQITNLKPPAVDAFLDEVGVPGYFVATVLTGTLEENTTAIAEFRALGQNFTRIEIGNEEYFRTPNPTARFPTAHDYSELAVSWSSSFKMGNPGVKTAAIAPSPVRQGGIGFDNWMVALERANAWSAVDAIAVHPYFDATNLDLGRDHDSAEELVKLLLGADDEYLLRISQRIPDETEIWISEWNTNEGDADPTIGGTWIQGLGNISRALNFLDHPKVEYTALHVLLGGIQWQALVGADGRAQDYDASTGLVSQQRPFSLTANGEAISFLTEFLAGAESVAKLQLGVNENAQPILGYRVTTTTGESRSIFINATQATIGVRMSGDVRISSAEPWSAVLADNPVTSQSVSASDQFVDLPPFSVALVIE